MKVKALVEVRGREQGTNKKGEDYILVRVEDPETGEPMEIIDKDMSRLDTYKRGKMTNLTLNLKDSGKYGIKMTIVDAELAAEE